MVRRNLNFLGDMAAIMALIAQAAARYGLDPGFVASVARRESGLNPNAVNPTSGAKGIMQLMDATAAMLGVTNPFDAAQNINAGVKYLAQLLNQFAGDTAKAVAAYDWGPGNVAKAIQTWGDQWLAHAPQETIDYVKAITGITPSTSASGPAVPGGIPSDVAPLTIDAATGQPIDDATPTPPAGWPTWLPDPSTPQGKIIYLTVAGIGAFLLADSIFGE